MTGPPARGVRTPYADLPPAVRAWVDSVLGSSVVAATTQPGGFSPGVAARLVGADGARAFVKVVDANRYPESARLHRREARVTGAMPAYAPVPALRAAYDDGAHVALVFDDVAGRPPQLPWERDELERVVIALDALAAALTPAPLPEAPTVVAAHADAFTGWRRLRDDPPAELDEWSRRHLDRLAKLEERWPAAAAGHTLVHCDVRADNLLLGDDGRVWFVDWPAAARGAAFVDLVFFAPSVAMQGGPEPEALLGRSAAGTATRPAAVTAVLAAIAGYFTQRALLPPPPGLPTVRRFQAAQGVVARGWLAARTGWA